MGFIDFMLKRKSLLEYANLFSWLWKEFKNNVKIYSVIKKMKKLLFVTSTKSFKNLKYYTFYKKR